MMSIPVHTHSTTVTHSQRQTASSQRGQQSTLYYCYTHIHVEWVYFCCVLRWLMNGEKWQKFPLLLLLFIASYHAIPLLRFALQCSALFNLNCFRSLNLNCWQIETIKVTEILIEFVTGGEMEINLTWFLRLNDNFVCCLKSTAELHSNAHTLDHINIFFSQYIHSHFQLSSNSISFIDCLHSFDLKRLQLQLSDVYENRRYVGVCLCGCLLVRKLKNKNATDDCK